MVASVEVEFYWLIAQADFDVGDEVALSGTNNLKLVQFFKLVLQYDYSIVLYMFLACTMQ